MRLKNRTYRTLDGHTLTEAEALRGLGGFDLQDFAFSMAELTGTTEAGAAEFRRLQQERRSSAMAIVQPPERERLRLEILKRLR